MPDPIDDAQLVARAVALGTEIDLKVILDSANAAGDSGGYRGGTGGVGRDSRGVEAGLEPPILVVDGKNSKGTSKVASKDRLEGAIEFEGAQGGRAEVSPAGVSRAAGDRGPGGQPDMILAVTASGVELRVLRGEIGLGGGKPMWVDLAALDVKSGAGRSFKQPLAKALGLHSKADLPLRVLDATAGLGEDIWLMAALGCDVTALERHGVVAALLRDGIQRARAAFPDVANRVQVVRADAVTYLTKISNNPAPWDVVYLDPMFPGAEDRKTLQRKPLRILRRLVGEDRDADALLPLALQVASKRVVVKRPPRAPVLAGREPTLSFAGKGVRWDVYVVKAMQAR